jgi:hypothetical protein
MANWEFYGSLVLVAVGVLATVSTKFLAAVVPHVVIRLAVLLWPKGHPARCEIPAEFVAVSSDDQESYAAGIVVAGIIDGLGARFSFVGRAWSLHRVLSELGDASPKPRLPNAFYRGLFISAIGLADLSLVFVLPGWPSQVICGAVGLALMTVPTRQVALRIWDAGKAFYQRIVLGPRFMVLLLLADYRRLDATEETPARASEVTHE